MYLSVWKGGRVVVIIRVLSGTRKSSKANNWRKEYQNDLEDGGGCRIFFPLFLGVGGGNDVRGLGSW